MNYSNASWITSTWIESIRIQRSLLSHPQARSAISIQFLNHRCQLRLSSNLTGKRIERSCIWHLILRSSCSTTFRSDSSTQTLSKICAPECASRIQLKIQICPPICKPKRQNRDPKLTWLSNLSCSRDPSTLSTPATKLSQSNGSNLKGLCLRTHQTFWSLQVTW